MVALIAATLVVGPGDHLGHLLEIIGMNHALVVPEVFCAAFQPEYFQGFFRPERLPGFKIPAPTPHPGNPLRLPQPGFHHLQVCLTLTQRFHQLPKQIPHNQQQSKTNPENPIDGTRSTHNGTLVIQYLNGFTCRTGKGGNNPQGHYRHSRVRPQGHPAEHAPFQGIQQGESSQIGWILLKEYSQSPEAGHGTSVA